MLTSGRLFFVFQKRGESIVSVSEIIRNFGGGILGRPGLGLDLAFYLIITI